MYSRYPEGQGYVVFRFGSSGGFRQFSEFGCWGLQGGKTLGVMSLLNGGVPILRALGPYTADGLGCSIGFRVCGGLGLRSSMKSLAS